MEDPVRELLGHLRRDRRLGAAHQHLELAAERVLVEAHGVGAVAVEGEIGDGLGHGRFPCVRGRRTSMPAALVEPGPTKSTAPFAHCTGAPLQDGFAALSPRFD